MSRGGGRGYTRPLGSGAPTGTAASRQCKTCQAKPWQKCRDLRPSALGVEKFRKTFHPGR